MSKQSNAVNIFQSTFDGAWICAKLPVEIIRSMLPAQFTIESKKDHSAYFFFGDQLRGAFYVGSRLVTAPISYNEWGVVIPFVKHKNSSETVSVISKMICNYPIATAVGKQVYGYNKQSGLMQWNDNTYHVAQSNPIMDITIDSPRGDSTHRPPMLNELCEHRIAGETIGGQLLYSHWDLDCSAAEVWSVGSNYRLHASFINRSKDKCGSVSSDNGVLLRGLMWKVSFPSFR